MREVLPAARAPQSSTEYLAWLVGTGFGSGLLRPFPATWGSLVGFACLAGLLTVPYVIAFPCCVLMLAAAVWSAGVCEQLFGRKDPKPVVIDEIACVPIALWPMWLLPQRPWWLWTVLFIVYRIFDVVKPWPGRRLERLAAGWGVLLDDFVAALYLGILFWGGALLFGR